MARNKKFSQISASVWSSKVSTMATNRGTRTTLFFSLLSILAFLAFIPVFAPLPSPSFPSFSHHHRRNLHKGKARGFEIHDDMFWKDDEPFQIIGGDVHYFRVLPQQWEDRLLRAKALGLNTIQTYVPWNLHEPKPGKLVFEGIGDLESFIKLCQKMDLLVMLRAGPYICAEWDLGGFPAWLLAIEPALKLRSSDPAYLHLVDRWWGILLPKLAPLLYNNGGPIIMVQVENEFGSYGNDKAYLMHLVTYARRHLGDGAILYTTDGGSRENLEKGTIRGDAVFSAVDFTTGDDPWPIFKLQKEFNSPGKSPPISMEFYTGWLTHWGEKMATTDANFTASALQKILSRNGSAVLYMALGGSNFGFYNGANTGADEYDYKPDLTSYDYDAPISEAGDVANAKFNALRRVIGRYSAAPLPSLPADNNKRGYGTIQLHRTAFLFDLVPAINGAAVVESENPVFMESVGQMFGFLLYVTEYAAKDDRSSLFIPKVNDRAQVFTLCHSKDNGGRPTYVGVIERWKNSRVSLPRVKCASNISLLILVENMGRVNYGKYMFDRKGILSSVYLDGRILRRWKMIPIPLPNLNEDAETKPFIDIGNSRSITVSAHKKLEDNLKSVSNLSVEPTFFCGRFSIKNVTQVQDTFMSVSGWGKGIAFVNDFNIGRYWPSVGPQCNLYVPAPLLRHGENTLVVLELESPNPGLVVELVDKQHFTCGRQSTSSTH